MYKVGDKVQVKSREWFEKNSIQNQHFDIICFHITGTDVFFSNDMFEYCGRIFEVVKVYSGTEKVYILNTNDTEIINTLKKTWIWSEKMIISVKKSRKKKLQKLNQIEI
jgi:hypothetical protein